MIDNYNTLTLGLYLDIDAVLQSDAEDIDKQVRIIALLDGTTPEAVLALPLKEYSAKAAATDFLRHECPPVSAPSRVISGDFVLIPTKDFTTISTRTAQTSAPASSPTSSPTCASGSARSWAA